MEQVPSIRTAAPADYDLIAPAVDQWWGRPILGSLPRLFLDLFYRTSLVIDGDDGVDAFLIGIFSPSDADRAYIHFVGVAPHVRRRGYGRLLYEEFFRRARAGGRSVVSAITAPVNLRSAEFHRSLGFSVAGPVGAYNGPGHEMLVFDRRL
jgi:ribosomal protein S18 acetylase RimI-like enzyme